MHIGIVIERYDPAAGGNERSTEQIASRLVERGHTVTVLTSRASGQPLPAGGRIVALGGLSTKTAAGLLRFARWAEREITGDHYDVSLSMTTAVAAVIVQPRGGTVQETLLRNIAMRPSELRRKLKLASIALSPKQLALLARESRTFRHAGVQKVIAISRYVADQLFHHYALSSRKVELIPNAAAVTPMNPVDRQVTRQQIRNALRLSDNDVAFLFAARNPALKGLPHLFSALSKVVATKPPGSRAKLIVAGVLDYSAMRPIERLGLDQTVRWIGPTKQMDALYAAADVTVLPTWYDPSSKVVLESLLHGVPAISTLYNGASQWILSPTGRCPIPSPFDTPDTSQFKGDPQPAGRVIALPSDTDALARAMIDLCDNTERDRCAAATIGLQNHISMDRHVEQLEAILIQAARTRPLLEGSHEPSGGLS